MVKALFEPNTQLNDSLTYDITAWALPYAYGLDCIASESEVIGDKGSIELINNPVAKDVYAYLIPWNSMSDAKALSDLINAGIKVRFAQESFGFGDKTYKPGTLIILSAENENTALNLTIASTCLKYNIDFSTTSSGMVDIGNDFGSSSVSLIQAPTVGLLTGEDTDPLSVGEVWHFLEQELNYPVTVLNIDALSAESLKSIDVIVVPEGWYELPEEELTSWVEGGGKLIVMGDAVENFVELEDLTLESKEEIDPTDVEKYENAHAIHSEKDRQDITDDIKGAIYKCKVDPSNPLAFGYSDSYFTLKRGATAYELLPEGDNVAYLEDNPEPVAGFAGAKAKEAQENSMIFGIEYVESGSIIYLADNPLFRGFWENGKLFFVNAIFFVNN